MNKPTLDEVRAEVSYCHNTGTFCWVRRKRGRGAKCGGLFKSTGYYAIGINYKQYYAHQLAWLLFYGYWPDNHVDHINGKRDDNRISNLRLVTHAENGQNRLFANTNSKTGVKGVSPCCGKFRAVILNKHIGVFNSLDTALAARQAAERSLFTHSPLHAV